MAIPRPRPRRTPAQQAAMDTDTGAIAEKGKRLLRRFLASMKAQYGGLDPETGELGETMFHNLKAEWDGQPNKKRTPGIVNEIKSLGTLPSDLAPLLPILLKKLNPISETAAADTIRPPSVAQLAQGSPLANAYSEAEPEGDPSYLEDLVNFAPPQWAEEAAQRASLGKEVATRDMGFDGPPTDLAEGGADAAGTMAAQLPVPAAWLRRLRGIRGAAEAKSLSGAVRSALGAPVEYLSPTIDPSLRNYASGTAFGAIANYLGAEEPDPPGYASGGAITQGSLEGLSPAVLRTIEQYRLAHSLAPITPAVTPTAAPVPGPTNVVPTTATPRTPTIDPDGGLMGFVPRTPTLDPDTGSGQTGFVPQPNTIPQPLPVPQPAPPPVPDPLPYGNDVMRPIATVDVSTGQITPTSGNNARFGNPQFRQPLIPGQAPPQADPVNLPTQGAGIYGPMAGSTAPPRRVNNPSDPQWWLTYGFGPEQNFYSNNDLPASGVPGGG